MKRIFIPVLAVAAAVAVVSCGGESSKEREQRQLIDSLETANLKKTLEYDDMKEYLQVIADGLDSIALEENELLVGNSVGEHFNRQRIKQNLDHVRDILARHRDRIDSLEAKLQGGSAEIRNLRTIITALRSQVDAKDRELASLRADLEDSRKNVADLTDRMQQISAVAEEQSQTIENQAATIERQKEEQYVAYMRIGTGKELEADGLKQKGNIFKKSSIDYTAFDTSKFQKIDTRTFRSLNLPKKAEIITTVPKGSFELVKTADGQILNILDPAKFWSVSKFLIIQVK